MQNQRGNRLIEEGRWLTMIGHVESSEPGVHVAQHGVDSVVAVNSAPATTRLPHSVDHTANLQPIVAAGNHGTVCALLGSARLRGHRGGQSPPRRPHSGPAAPLHQLRP